jgi:chaperonin GroEL (HSP60 family)
MSGSETKLTHAGVVKKATHAKVAVYTCGLDISQTETKGTVLLKKADELMDFTRGEEKQLEGVSPASSFYQDPNLTDSTLKRLPTLASSSSSLGLVSEI